MKQKYLEMKLAIIEKEINRVETKIGSLSFDLRVQKTKQWEIIEQLEKMESEI